MRLVETTIMMQMLVIWCMVAIAEGREQLISIGEDDVLYIGDNRTETHVRVAGTDIRHVVQRLADLETRNKRIKAENKAMAVEMSIMEAGNSAMKQQLARLKWRDIKELYTLTVESQSYDYFGRAVSVDGDVLVVGAYRENGAGNRLGAVHVFEKHSESEGGSESGAFGFKYKLAASDAASYARFGVSVFVAGELLLVGADGDGGTGSVYVFEKNSISGVFEEKYKLTASDAASMDYFGSSVSSNGNQLFVGAAWDDDKGSNSGSVYVFERNSLSGKFEEKYKLTPNKEWAVVDSFGQSVSVDGDLLLVGAPNTADESIRSGAVYVFEKNSSSGVFEEKYVLRSSDASNGDSFGQSVSVDGDLLVVGANRADGQTSDEGFVYIFEKNSISGVFEEQYKLTASNVVRLESFGSAVAVDAERMFVGSDGREGNKGAVYVFALPK